MSFSDMPSGFIERPSMGGDSGATFSDLKEISSGGVCRLVRARRYGRYWMLKGLSAGLEDSTIYQRLLDKEFGIMAEMQHPNVVSFIGMEDVGGLGRCIVMEWIDGVTLDRWLLTRPSRHERRRVWNQLLDAVQYIHSCQVVHRDLKPSNIMITRNGCNAKIIDFGLGDTDSHVALKQPAGTPGYISPEQQSGAITDARNDIYSLGLVLADLKPFAGWKRVSIRCLAPATKRYQTVADLRRACSRQRALRVWGLAALAAVAACAAVVCLLPDKTQTDTPTPPVPAELPSSSDRSDGSDQSESTARPDFPDQSTKSDSFEQPGGSDSRPTVEPDIERILARGKGLIDELVSQSGVEARIDTMTRQIYFDKELVIVDEVGALADRYSSSEATIDSVTRFELKNRLLLYANERYFLPWGQRLGTLPR